MYQRKSMDQMSCLVRDCANINTLWASLIVEECTRLGLTYFCVAPGSRSSPLAVAASSHPLTTCIACIDERSLAFHAVGYARGSQVPAVVITSSGTAASNLLPAVVEASQDFIPLLLLTADRPPELQDVGANQSINQVNHYGSFVRRYFGLPPPSESIFARMVLTTVDSAVHMATSSPSGPVHINCPFREPLENSPRKWSLSCLKGLELWISNSKPFTSYLNVQHSSSCNHTDRGISEVLRLIQGANNGLLLLGATLKEDDMWAALLLAKHLSWPVVADILSGLRLRKCNASFSELEENILFVDHLDHLLLSDSVRDLMRTDVIIQIGCRITSKRISQMLEHSFPFSYIMVDKHSNRHDPLHIVTHRIHCSVTEFTDCLIGTCPPRVNGYWRTLLRGLDMMAAREISLLVDSEYSLTEPYVARAVPGSLHYDSAIFFGNSMPIRDADMYGCKWTRCTNDAVMMLSKLPCHWIPVAGNRGASGIDGLLSTTVGYAIGCNKKVISVIGDVSFLHDTNGLALMQQRVSRKPVAVLVVNNHGGAIFSLLPIAGVTEQSILDKFFYTSHDVSIKNLCVAHGLKHLQVRTKRELQDALFTFQQEDMDCVIEVESSIDANANFHSLLRTFVQQVADHALCLVPKPSVSASILDGFEFYKITKMNYSLYRIQLCSPPTSAVVTDKSTASYREGFLITIILEDGSTGFGEVAPLDVHQENLLEVEDQLQFLIHVIEGATIDCFLPLLKGSLSSWIWKNLGILPESIFPSVRCGLEMAVLNAVAAGQNSSLLDILHPRTDKSSGGSLGVQICALVDSNGSPMEMAYVANELAEEGFSAIKLKVARRADPSEDAMVIQEVRRRVGQKVELRADANRNWTYDEAISFAKAVRNCGLQYIEEPVRNEDDIIKFCEETGLPVALDETINNITENPFKMLEKYSHPGVVAVVIKPSVIGGFEKAALVGRWAQQHGKMAVVSAAFEGGLGLSSYVQFSCYLDLQNVMISNAMNKRPAWSIAHGLGTYKWLKEDVTLLPLNISCNPCTGVVEASVVDAGQLVKQFQMNQDVIVRTSHPENVRRYQLKVDLDGVSFSTNVLDIGDEVNDRVLVFLHGFLGTSGDWIPIMSGISRSARCIAIDLPGHGGSRLQGCPDNDSIHGQNLSIEVVAHLLYKLFHNLTPKKVSIVGYSMGARIALYMALKWKDMVEAAVVISGSPGLSDPEVRRMRRRKDDFRACSLISFGLESFVEAWYADDLWSSLRGHPRFKKMIESRLQHDDLQTLAKALSDMSVGRQPPLWEDLQNCERPLLLIVGEKDAKFKKIANQICREINLGTNRSSLEIVEIPNSGHAVHLENPLPVIKAVNSFLKRLRRS